MALFLFLLVLWPADPVSASKHTNSVELTPGTRYDLDIKIDDAQLGSVSTSDSAWESKTYTVRSGDNLALIFNRAGLSAKDTHHVSRAGEHAKRLLKIMPGHTLDITTNARGEFVSLSYPYDKTETLHITKNSEGIYSTSVEKYKVDIRLNYSQGDIQSSFWNAGKKASLTDAQIMDLAGIFGWDIDFALEIRQGDTFNIIYEERYIDGEFIGHGSIIAAEFVNQGEIFRAIRFDDGRYYTPDGRSMRKSFLRAPVSFKYISSNFTMRRFHPVQKRWKAHRGIDYAAERGTPVMASGDGRVVKSAYDKYNGHHVFIQHGEKYTTKYLHFTKRHVKKGQWVKQGQMIGTVGSTGLASGPHLHYEFLVDGVHRNPRTVELPKAQPIANQDREAFALVAKERGKQLDNTKRILLAMN